MKIRNKPRSIDISDIMIYKHPYGTDITFIINEKVHKLTTSAIYFDVVMKLINDYVEGLENEERIIKM